MDLISQIAQAQMIGLDVHVPVTLQIHWSRWILMPCIVIYHLGLTLSSRLTLKILKENFYGFPVYEFEEFLLLSLNFDIFEFYCILSLLVSETK